MKTFVFDFEATERGYGLVCAETKEEAKEKILSGEYEDIVDTYDMEITKVTNIEVEEE